MKIQIISLKFTIKRKSERELKTKGWRERKGIEKEENYGGKRI